MEMRLGQSETRVAKTGIIWNLSRQDGDSLGIELSSTVKKIQLTLSSIKIIVTGIQVSMGNKRVHYSTLQVFPIFVYIYFLVY